VHVLDHPEMMRDWSRSHRRAGRRIGVVPTMGALHDGHFALVDEARRIADVVVVTIFVNPLQFNQTSDFDRYPRAIDGDLAACDAAGVDAVYAPTAAVMYPSGFQTHVEPGALADRLEGPMRPGHFRGVTTVVTKLLATTEPDVAMFGRKDYQQLAIVRRMVRDLDLGVEVVGIDTVREEDGLARSSRNVRLTATDRAAARVIPLALGAAVDAFAGGERSAARLRELVVHAFGTEPRARIEYVELVDADDLTAVDLLDEPDHRAVLLVAAWFGDVRLIDNVVLG
jgi:pantoate--beta-alanine ligase